MQNLEGLAKKKGVTPGQLALAWVTAQGEDVIPIPGTKLISCVDENIAAAFIKLTAEEIKELEDAVPHHEVRCKVQACVLLPSPCKGAPTRLLFCSCPPAAVAEG